MPGTSPDGWSRLRWSTGRRVPDCSFVSHVVFALLSGMLIGVTALAAGAAMRLRTLPELLSGAYALAVAEVVVLALALSPLAWLRRPALLAGLLLACAISLSLWWRVGRPVPPVLRTAFAIARGRPRNAAVVALLAGATLASAYAVVLALGTPPVTWDALHYHLTRAAFWRQDGAIGYIAQAFDARLNANPPHAEILLAFALELTRDERATAFVQLSAWLACGIGVVALARRLGLSRAEAVFGGAAFLLLPIVVLQSSTTHNDLVVASLLVVATVFTTRRARSELALAGLAVGLAVGTKVTAVYAAPILLAVALLAEPRDAGSRIRRVAALGAGAAAGSWWYAMNALHTGDVLGHTPDRGHVEAFQPAANVLAALARVLDALELTGVREWGGYAYVLTAATFAVVLLLLARWGRIATPSALLAGVLAFAPLLLFPVSYATWRVFAKLHDIAGTPPGLLPLGGWEPQTLASEDQSWFGPVGTLLVIGVGASALVLVRRGSLHPLALVLATAPVAWLTLVSGTLGYDPWQGRFFVFPVALAASLWGLVLRCPPVAWATALVTLTIGALTLVQYDQKPLTAWPGAERWELQSRHRPEVRPLLRFLEERAGRDTTVAVALVGNGWAYPAFGPKLERRVLLVPRGADARDVAADWLLADIERVPELSHACWTPTVVAEGGALFARLHAACP